MHDVKLWLAGWLLALCGATAMAQFTARPTINVTGSGNVPTESSGGAGDYVPNVVLCENGLASFEALKAQAVAARTFAYYKMHLQGFINDGTSDQVFTCAGDPLPIHHAAARATEGEILYVFDDIPPTGDVLIASFFVAGAIPSGPFNPDSPSAIPNPGDPDPTNTEKWVTYTFENNLSGGQNTGTPLGFQGTPTNPNWPNRGAMSQNGSDFLSDNSISYVDILKYYYGADIQLRTATTAGTGIEFGLKVLTDFDDFGDRFGNTFSGHEGYFHRSPTFSGSTTANVAGSTAERSSAEQRSGTHSQLINITYDESSGTDFLLRHLSGARFSAFGGSLNAATRVANLQFEAIGSVGFWLKTETEGISVTIALDDPVTADRGVFKPVIADGLWHRYEWFLQRDEDWEAWLANGNGVIDGETVSIDSIQFVGASDAQIYLDDVFWDPQAVFEPGIAGDYNGDGLVDAADYTLWRDHLGGDGSNLQNRDPSLAGMPVGQGDYAFWATNFGNSSGDGNLSQSAAAVPEPASILLAVCGLVVLLANRR